VRSRGVILLAVGAAGVLGLQAAVSAAPARHRAPAPAAATPAAATTTIEDTAVGTGPNQLRFSANWNKCTTTCGKAADGSYQWTSTVGSAVTVRFAGTRIAVYGVKEPWSHIATMAIDGGATVDADYYSARQTGVVRVWRSPVLASGNHTLVITMSDRRNPASANGDAITLDRVVVTATPPPTTPPTPTQPTPTQPPTTQPPTTTPPGNPTGQWPGPNGKSGVNGDPVIDAASVRAFCTWRKRDCGVAEVYTDRSDWQHMTNGSGWLYANFAGFPGQLIVSQGLVPNGGHADMGACASGTHNQDWRNFGAELVANHRGASVVRLGWEFNGTFMPWWGENTQTYVDCFRNAALNIRASDPQVVIDWTINSHGTPSQACGGTSTNCYPGDDVVDIVGIDNYDQGPSAASKADFDTIAAAPDGLSWILAFAQQHKKKLSVGEWGVAPGSQWNTAGENPQFIQWMHDWFAAHAGDIAYEAYFNTCTSDDLQSNLFRPVGSGCVRQNTNAASVYQRLWGA
jgi:Glycosyl hydrolase family 26